MQQNKDRAKPASKRRVDNWTGDPYIQASCTKAKRIRIRKGDAHDSKNPAGKKASYTAGQGEGGRRKKEFKCLARQLKK